MPDKAKPYKAAAVPTHIASGDYAAGTTLAVMPATNDWFTPQHATVTWQDTTSAATYTSASSVLNS